MGASTTGPRVSADTFERLYERDVDPWGYDSRAYEREKYAATLAALGARSYGRALELGCSIGAFTELLSSRCGALTALDFSPRAVALARARTRLLTNVTIREAAFPEQVPAGSWDLVVCSEVLYYLDRATLERALDWLDMQLRGAAVVIAVSWRGSARTEPLTGDEVHERLTARFASSHALTGLHPGYRLDRFDGATA
ncbi:MAG TPA: SAM-dependent methyltransferase [Solirubrobacteraceae bacterium]|nr:SAM-dependent methyltransferase [Solirubrobacteraceae bacterium]